MVNSRAWCRYTATRHQHTATVGACFAGAGRSSTTTSIRTNATTIAATPDRHNDLRIITAVATAVISAINTTAVLVLLLLLFLVLLVKKSLPIVGHLFTFPREVVRFSRSRVGRDFVAQRCIVCACSFLCGVKGAN